MPDADGRLFEPELAERVLARALAHGGDFAELYAERRSELLGGAGRPQARARAERQRARRSGAGDRRRLDLLRPRRRAGRGGLERVADGVAAAVQGQLGEAAGAAGAGAAARPGDRAAARGGGAARKAEMLRACDERARAAAPKSLRSARATPRTGARSRSPTPRDCWPPTTARACGSACRRSRAADERVETGAESLAGHAGFELFAGDFAAVADEAARRALTMLDARPAPAGPMTVVVGNGFGGVLFHEATGHGLESDAVQKRASVYAGRLGEQVAGTLVTAYDDGSLAGRVGHRRDRRRGHADSEHARDRRGQARLLPLRPDPGRKDGTPVDRQRPPPELPPPADPAHDQHLHRAGRRDPAGHHRRRQARGLRGLVRGRPGRARDRQLRLRRLRGLPDRGRAA